MIFCFIWNRCAENRKPLLASHTFPANMDGWLTRKWNHATGFGFSISVLWIHLLFSEIIAGKKLLRRWPFGRSAGRFTAPIAQSGLFWGQKCCFSAGNSFFRHIIQKNCSHCDGTPKRQQFCVDSLHGGPLGGRQGPFLAQNWPQKLSFFMLHPVAPIFGAQTDYTLWDHNFPISWGNSDFFQFSNLGPFRPKYGR